MQILSNNTILKTDRILVTGAGGFIGVRVVNKLLMEGYTNLCCFVRPSSNMNRLKAVLENHSVKPHIVTGDLLSRKDCVDAVSGVSVIIHLAAGFDKSFAGAFMNSALCTRNLLDAFAKEPKRKRIVNVSSFSVYSNLQLKRGGLMDESCALEDSHQTRNDAYGFGKLKQEQLVMEYGEKSNLPYVILRPGSVFGPGKSALSGRIAIDTFGFMIQIGGNQLIPLTYVDNCADAIVLASIKPGLDREIFNVVDDELLTARQFLKAYKKSQNKYGVEIHKKFSIPVATLEKHDSSSD